MKKNIKLFLLFFILVALYFVISFPKKSNTNPLYTEADSSLLYNYFHRESAADNPENTTDDTVTEDFEYLYEGTYKKGDALPISVSLEVEEILQNPELPSGCESVSLTMLLNYYGFGLSKTEIADNYLIYNDNYLIGFFGNPRNAGGGCYSPGLTNTANRFLLSKDSVLHAYDISGTSLEDLFLHVANGHPVIVWSTVSLIDSTADEPFYTYNGTEYGWNKSEHCVLLVGYNISENTVTIKDPLIGTVTYHKETFKKSYNTMWKMSIVIGDLNN